MKVRIAVGLGGTAVDGPGFAGLVSDLAEFGFDSLWVSEVLTGPGPDPLIALATAAQLHPKLKLGTTLLLPGRNELRLAKALATLDVLSGGRLLLTMVPGIARGLERDAVGVPVGDRAGAIERTMPRLRQWWAGEAVDGVRIEPLPVQQPLEMWLGGLAPASLDRCGRLADGWLGASCTVGEARTAIAAIRSAAAAAGRAIDPEHFGMSIAYTPDPLSDAQRDALAARLGRRGVDPAALVPVGGARLRELIERFVEVGISKFVVRRIGSPTSWRSELEALAVAVGDLQT
ncbi:MAG: LLM class flavin-dependent oxidoreductase [Frankiaceae bacterium]|nr:LLM class flavin-dependent oxidoreductase [Frankiaceae bacterium]MBV9872074.1 LLM class flavin-dependent oxidoreductase [Frankiaceae bacterium]